MTEIYIAEFLTGLIVIIGLFMPGEMVKVKTADLTGKALDYAVATIGIAIINSKRRGSEHHERRWFFIM